MTSEQVGICSAVSKHFKIAKKVIAAQAEEYFADMRGNHPVLSLDLAGTKLSIGVSKNTLRVGEMLFFKYLEKSKLYEDLLNLFTNSGAEAIVFFSGSFEQKILMTLSEEPFYTGVGGIFIRKNIDSALGYAIEPIANYLQRKYPIHEEA